MMTGKEILIGIMIVYEERSIANNMEQNILLKWSQTRLLKYIHPSVDKEKLKLYGGEIIKYTRKFSNYCIILEI